MKFTGPLSILMVCLVAAMQAPAPGQQSPTDSAPTLPSQSADTGTTHGHTSDSNTGGTARDSGHGPEIAGIAAGVVATTAIIYLIHRHEVLNRLKSNGPQLPRAFDMNNLHITGFVQDDWPVAVEYALAGSVPARCNISTRHKRGWFVLPATNGERHIMLARIPPKFGYSKKPEVADFWLRLDASPIPLAKSGWPGLRVYAVAAGPRAVGSVAIDQVSFAPTSRPVHATAGEAALFGFHSHSDFDSVTAEFQLVAPYQGRNFVSTEESMNVRPVSEGERVQGLRWQPHRVRWGDHMVRIVAWRGINRGADWVSAFSADIVSIEN